MNFSNYRFTLDMQSNISQVSIPVRLMDTGRRLLISLTDGGNPYILSEGCEAKFFFLKSVNQNGVREGNIYDCVIEDNYSTIRFDLTPDVTDVPGVVDCEIRLYSAAGRILTSPSFLLVVDDRVMSDEDIPLTEQQASTIDTIIISEAERVAAEEARQQASQEAVENANTAADNANSIADTLTQKLEAGELNGESVAHEWDGTTLIIRSASGTSSADLKGEPGKPGHSNLRIYEAQAPQEDGTFAFEQGKKYKIYAPSKDGKFICTINLTKEEYREGGSVYSNYALVTNIPCENNADNFVFELLYVDNSMGTYYYSYMIDNTIYDKDNYEGSYAVVHPHGCISGATKVGIPTDEAFINPEGESGSDGKSAYEIALDKGFEGTEEEWLESLKGKDGKDGTNGTNGTNGKDGTDGKDGSDGERGFSILKITKAPTEYTTETGGFTPSYRVALSTVKTQSKADKVLVGDTLAYSYYQYPIGYVDSSYVYVGARVSIRGTTGAAGKDGADGYTPQREIDYWTPADQEAIVQQVISALGTPVFGRIDENNNIILTGNLADGTYILKYEDAEGTIEDVGEIVVGTAEEILDIAWQYGVKLNKNAIGHTTVSYAPASASDTYYASPYIKFEEGATYIAGFTESAYQSFSICQYKASGEPATDSNVTWVGYQADVIKGPQVDVGQGGPMEHTIVQMSGATHFRIRAWSAINSTWTIEKKSAYAYVKKISG